MINFDFIQPQSVTSALTAAGKEKSLAFISGGTNIVDLMKRGVSKHEKIADINALPMHTIERLPNGGLRIGALVRNSELAEHPIIKSDYPLLAAAVNAGASAQIRNMASTGGNMLQRTRCSYFYDLSMKCNKRAPGSGCDAIGGQNRMHAVFGTSDSCIAVHPSDMCVALAAIGAKVHISTSKGTTYIPFDEFHRLPGNTPHIDTELKHGELITAVELAPPAFQSKFHYLKVRDRNSYAFALVSVAAGLKMSGNTINEARLAMGGVAHKPWRLYAAESFLRGKQATADNFQEAGAVAFMPAKSYGHNAFKLKMGPRAVVEALTIAAAKK